MEAMSLVERRPRVYRGSRDVDGAVHVTVEGPDHVLRPLRHLVFHSPTGLEWGFCGSGPADLARSLLADFLGYEPQPAVYQGFKEEIVAHLDHQGWRLEAVAVAAGLERVARRLAVSCVRCLDEGEVYDRRLGARRCPSCAPGPARIIE